MPLLLGSYAPDMMSKWFEYGIHIGGYDLKASDPVQFHRGWPGVGFTHSLLYGVVWCLIFWRVFGSKTWGISFLIGQWAHAITDTGDTVGTMLFFPWTIHTHFGAWAYAGQTGRTTDAAAYFSGAQGQYGTWSGSCSGSGAGAFSPGRTSTSTSLPPTPSGARRTESS